MPFQRLKLIEPLLRAVRSQGYTIPTAIQREAIPYVLEGRDLLGCAQTGTGKTAAFALPILQLLHGRPAAQGAPHGQLARHIAGGPAHPTAGAQSAHPHAPARTPVRALILTPTRELAAQIDESFGVYGQFTGLRHAVVFGGVSQHPQVQAIRQGVDILVATPGRLLDLINQRVLSIREIEIFVLDEADRMLDMGFIHDIRRVIALIPRKRQTLMFSATMPKEIQAMADQILTHPVEVRVPSESPAADTVQQSLYFVPQALKSELLYQLLQNPELTKALVFTRTKRWADRVAKRLTFTHIATEVIHSDKSQKERTRALETFKHGKTRVLVASDIAARGLDVDDISHVVNYDLPLDPETYVHRIGRTGRAGARGQAITFCTDEQHDELRAIEKLLGRRIPVLQHSLKPQPGAPKDTAQGHRGGQNAQHPQQRPGSADQQKNRFWQSRRKTHRQGSGRRRGR
ncbi:MAG: DEAD/DEAH box helicase [Candidatus Brocadiia bacterium]